MSRYRTEHGYPTGVTYDDALAGGRGYRYDTFNRRGFSDTFYTGGDTEYSYQDRYTESAPWSSGYGYTDDADRATPDRRYMRGESPHSQQRKSGGRVERYHVDRTDGRRWAVEVYKNRGDYEAAIVGGVTSPRSAATKSWVTHSTDYGCIDHAAGDDKPWWLWEEPPIPEKTEPIRLPWDYPVEEELWEDMHWRSGAAFNNWQPNPIQSSLLRPSSAGIGHLATQMFHDLMVYMGDQALPDGVNRSLVALKILDTVHEHPELADELYCQICKQTTKNESPNPDSNRLGWRLMALVTCFFPCSETLKPYLTKYFLVNANDADACNTGVVLLCRNNLEKTIAFGGRKTQPSFQELEAHTIGRTNKRQTIALPNNTRRTVNITASSIVEDCVSEICNELGITDPTAMEEYAIFCVIEQASEYSIITADEYIFDVLSELDSGGLPYFLLFQRNSWLLPLRFTNAECNDIHYSQISRDYVDGLYLIVRETGFPNKQMEEIAVLGALLHVIKEGGSDVRPTSRSVLNVIPTTLRLHPDYDANRWLRIIQNKVYGLGRISEDECKVRFLEILCNWFLFGATFTSVESVSESIVKSPCLMAVNRRGVMFLNSDSREIYMVVEYKEIESARRYTAENRGYLDIRRCRGKSTIRLQSDHGNDVALLIGQYITVSDAVRGQY